MPNRPPPILPIEGVSDKLLQAINSRLRGLGEGNGTGATTAAKPGPPGPPGVSSMYQLEDLA
jgi:hypothetical protein